MPEWMFRLLFYILPVVSKPLRAELETFARKFREDALKTENQMDDLLAEVLCWFVGIK